METLEQVMAFPLFATVVWLVWVLSAQRGPGAVTRALWALLLAGFAAWLHGRTQARASGARRAVAVTVIVLVTASAVWLVVPSGAPDRSAAAEGAEPTDAAWIDWAPGVVERLRAEGRPVYVDFTARWCVTCQVNKLVVFGSREVVQALAERDVALVRADWTSYDPRITEALAAFGRSGVPLNVYYPPGRDSEPFVLPSVLSPGIVLDAIGASRSFARTRRTAIP
jgi:thiol:disulfide interchange protein DsbD